MLLGQQLQKAGLKFISAKGSHTAGGLHIDDIVCPTREDADAAQAWADGEGFPVRVRVATQEELAEHARWAEYF